MAVDQGVPNDAVAVVPSDTLNMFAVGLYVGGAGDVVLKTARGTVTKFAAVGGGSLLPIAVQMVMATGTTATNIVALKP